MRVKVSKTMIKAIKEYINSKNLGKYIQDIYIDKISEQDYKRNIFDNFADYDIKTNTYTVIMVVYPQDYFAPNKILTTSDLRNCYYNSDKTYNDFMYQVWQEIEI